MEKFRLPADEHDEENCRVGRRKIVALGEIVDDRVVRLLDPRTPVVSTLRRRETGRDLNLEGRDLDHISFDVAKGEIFGFLGPNGAGKSTTIRMLCGILQPTSGTGRVGGFDIGREPDAVKRIIGYMSQKFTLYGDLTVGENIDFHGDIRRLLFNHTLGHSPGFFTSRRAGMLALLMRCGDFRRIGPLPLADVARWLVALGGSRAEVDAGIDQRADQRLRSVHVSSSLMSKRDPRRRWSPG